MNQKDYKVIAEILRSSYIGSKLPLPMKKDLVNRLADYFERESETGTVSKALEFNREQFLKDCGVE